MAAFAIISLAALLIISVIMFLNELYYRKRISSCGMIVFLSTLFLMYYLDVLNKDILHYAVKLAKYQQVDIPKGD
jgi:hypothetical protein